MRLAGTSSRVSGRLGALVSLVLFGVLMVMASRRLSGLSDIDPLEAANALWALPAYLVANVVLADTWTYLMSMAGQPLRRSRAYWIWSSSQIARYMIGFAQVGTRSVMTARAGLGATSGAITSLVELGFFLATTSTLALLTAPSWSPTLDVPSVVSTFALVPPLVVASLVAAPRLLNFLAGFVSRIPWLPSGVRRRATVLAHAEPFTRAAFSALPLRYGLNTCLRLAGFLIIIAALGGDVQRSWPAIVGAHAVSNFLGSVAVFAPGGLGVREGSSAVMLAPAVGGDVALIAVTLVRVAELVAELLFLGACLITRRRLSPDDPGTEGHPAEVEPPTTAG